MRLRCGTGSVRGSYETKCSSKLRTRSSHIRGMPEPYGCADLDHGTAAISDFGYASRFPLTPEPATVPSSSPKLPLGSACAMT